MGRTILLKIDHHSGGPACKQLMEQIRFLIGSGLLKAGDEMPSTREEQVKRALSPGVRAATQLGVSRTEAARLMKELF